MGSDKLRHGLMIMACDACAHNRRTRLLHEDLLTKVAHRHTREAFSNGTPQEHLWKGPVLVFVTYTTLRV